MIVAMSDDHERERNAARYWSDQRLAAFLVEQYRPFTYEQSQRLARAISQGPLADVWNAGVSTGRSRQQRTASAAYRRSRRAGK